MAFDNTSPAQGHQALNDIDQIRSNLNELRRLEQSPSTSPPTNPEPAMLWWATDTKTLYQRSADNTTWIYLWKEGDPPAKTSDLNNHIDTNITNTVAVHGIKQGSGNGFDADMLDGKHASEFAAANHSHFPVGTKMVFYQASAPPGWKQITGLHDKCLRVVDGAGGGTGGSRGISSVSVGDTTLTESQIPSHTHSLSTNGSHRHGVATPSYGTEGTVGAYIQSCQTVSYSALYTDYAGGHTHTVGSTGGGQPHTHNLSLAYVDVIICEKV